MNAKRDQEMLRLYNEEHLTLREIGTRYGVKHQRVSQILTQLNYSPRKRKPGMDYDTLKRYSKQDWTADRISLDTGYSKTYIQQLAKQYGIKLRHGWAIAPETVTKIYDLHQRGFSQVYIANRLGVSQAAVSNYIRNIA
jgi:predicted DNA-binding protein YlxM (UPF0122 family)